MKIPPLVPAVICFDETSKRLGASRPTWPTKSFRKHPWITFVQRSRDARVLVQNEDVRAQIQRAEAALEAIAKVEQKDHIAVGSDQWMRFQRAFREDPRAALQACTGHVWQAIDAAFRPKDQCCRCRCYYQGVELVFNNDESVWGKDTKVTDPGRRTDFCTRSSDKVAGLGPCAEHCLYVEEVLEHKVDV